MFSFFYGYAGYLYGASWYCMLYSFKHILITVYDWTTMITIKRNISKAQYGTLVTFSGYPPFQVVVSPDLLKPEFKQSF